MQQGVNIIGCPACGGYQDALKVFLVPPQGYVQPDVCYDSPIDGRPITSRQARIEDMRRNGCREYDPGEKEEVVRNRQKADANLDKALDETVEKEVALMSPRKRELLEQEVLAGATTEITRKTYGTR